jgi:methylmalonyl-CoA/ethylmalonyl-CoA epimerase
MINDISTPKIEGIGQIAIAVSDIDVAREFYKDILELEHLFDAPPGLAFFQCGAVRLMLTIQNGDINDHRTSVIYYQSTDIEGMAIKLKAHGIVFEQEPQLVAKMPDHDLWMGFIRDPDQNLIGIMAELPPNE